MAMAAPSAVSTPKRKTPKPSPPKQPVQLPKGLVNLLRQDEVLAKLVHALALRRDVPSIVSLIPGIDTGDNRRGKKPSKGVVAATSPAATHTSSGTAASGPPKSRSPAPLSPDFLRREVLETCRLAAEHRVSNGSWPLPWILDLLDVLAAECRGLPGTAPVVDRVARNVAAAAHPASPRAAAGGGDGGWQAGSVLSYAGLVVVRGAGVTAKEAAALLPRLMTVLADLGYDNQDTWEVLFRLMHSNMRSYTGAEVASLVRVLQRLDDAAAAAAAATAATPQGSDPAASGNDSSWGGGGGGGLWVRQLEHPAMRQRLEALVKDGGIQGDDSATVLLGLVGSGAPGVSMDVVAAWLRRSLQSREQLSPQGWVQLLQAVSRFCDRCPDGATEVVSLLDRYQPGLLPALADGVAAQAARMPPRHLTDVSQALCRLRYCQPDFLTEMARSMHAAIKAKRAETRDVTMSLYACAFFAHRHEAVERLFATAAEELGGARLRSVAPATLARVVMSYAVAGACGLVPTEAAKSGRRAARRAARKAAMKKVKKVATASELRAAAAAAARAKAGADGEEQQQEEDGEEMADEDEGLKEPEEVEEEDGEDGAAKSDGRQKASGEKVDRFLEDLSATLLQRANEFTGPSLGEAWQGVQSALHIWAALRPTLAPQELLQKFHKRWGGRSPPPPPPPPQQPPSQASQPQLSRPPPSPLELQRPSLLRGPGNTGGGGDGGSGGGGGGGGLRQGPSVSELQKSVFRRLRELGYQPKMEDRVGVRPVDIMLVVEGVRVAVEVDGPYHFTTSQPRRPLGSTLARDACLRALGCRVVAVDYQSFGQQRDSSREETRALHEMVMREVRSAQSASRG